jgi:hypothetical protein
VRFLPSRLRNQIAATALILVAASACDLEVTNPNEPDRDRALSEPGDIESLIAGTYSTWWDQMHGAGDELAMVRALSSAAEVLSSAAANHFASDNNQQPRITLTNAIGYQWGRSLRAPWMELNQALAAIRDGVQVVETDDLQIGANGQDTPRTLAFAKLMQGLNHGYIANVFDQGFIIDETVDVEAAVENADLRPYGEVAQAAIGYLQAARQIASQNPFTVPSGWMGTSVSSEELIRMINSWEARLMTTVARTPEERAQVNWSEVLSLAEQGVTADYGINTVPGDVWDDSFNSPHLLSIRFVGPADQSGAWQAYEAANPRERFPIHVETDDQRVHAPGDPEASGTVVEIPGTLFGDAQRGIWFVTPYRTWKWRDKSDTGFGFIPELTVRQMEFLMAEAHIRLGRPEMALPYINPSRVAAGLPPATVDGVSGDRCVPRTITGECGSVLFALWYEKQMELLFETGGLDYFDQRGFGTLRAGTPLHMPVIAEELEALKLETYSFGGEGNVDTASGWSLR